MKTPLPPPFRIENQVISQRTVHLDYHSFYKCSFQGCVLVFSGNGSVGLEGCSFDAQTRWVFEGPAMATIEVLRAIRTQGPGGAQVVQEVIQAITSGRPVARA